MAVTISDIAKEAGVSTATVSRMMNQSGYVSAKSKEKVEKAIKKLNYSPNAAAISLSKRESKVIGLMVPEISNAFFAEVIEGISCIADQAGYALMLFDSSESVKKELRALQMLRQQNLCGLILTPVIDVIEKNPNFYDCLKQLDIPIVLLDRDVEGLDVSGVFTDNVSGAYKLTRALQEKGHKRIYIMAGDQSLKLGRERLEGFEKAVGLEGVILQGGFKRDQAKSALIQAIETGPQPEAILSCNNVMTEGVIDALNSLSLLGKVDIATYDNLRWVDYIGVSILQLNRKPKEMGKQACRLLFESLGRDNEPSRKKIIIETEVF